METTGRLDRGDGVELASARLDGRSPTVVFLPGFRSDMTGDKATALAAFCAERGQAMIRFDYSGHGSSGGSFQDGTIGRWTEDALAVIDRLSEGKLVLVGSSMGGWIALLAARARLEPRRRADRHRRRARLHRNPDVGGDDLRGTRHHHARRGPECAEPIRRTLPHHPHADRGWPHTPAAERADRDRLSGTPAARPAGCRRAMGNGAAHRRTGDQPATWRWFW